MTPQELMRYLGLGEDNTISDEESGPENLPTWAI